MVCIKCLTNIYLSSNIYLSIKQTKGEESMTILEYEFRAAQFLHKCRVILAKGTQYCRDNGLDDSVAVDRLVDIFDIEDNGQTFNRLYENAWNDLKGVMV